MYTSVLFWPTKDVTPVELDIVNNEGINAADHGSYFLMREKAKAEMASALQTHQSACFYYSGIMH